MSSRPIVTEVEELRSMHEVPANASASSQGASEFAEIAQNVIMDNSQIPAVSVKWLKEAIRSRGSRPGSVRLKGKKSNWQYPGEKTVQFTALFAAVAKHEGVGPPHMPGVPCAIATETYRTAT